MIINEPFVCTVFLRRGLKVNCDDHIIFLSTILRVSCPCLSQIASCSGLCHSLLHFVPAIYCPSNSRLLFTHHPCTPSVPLVYTLAQHLCYIMVVFSVRTIVYYITERCAKRWKGPIPTGSDSVFILDHATSDPLSQAVASGVIYIQIFEMK